MNHRRILPFALRTLLLLALCALPFAAARAQSATATLSGTIEDQNGAVIPGVDVTIENLGTTLRRQAKTNESGTFTVPLLSPGHYRITARRDGFSAVQIPDVVLNVGDQKALQIQLKTGSVNATVQVTNDAMLINESPAVGTVVDRQFVENIPLNGRSFQSLITSVPGVVSVPGASTGLKGEFSVNGQRTEANYYTVDGVSANTGSIASVDLGGTSGSLPGETALGTTQSLVSLDALQEFRIQTSTYSAEYGRTPGGQISFLTRSGDNQFHGSVYDYLRNQVLDANNWFNNRNRIAKPKEQQNDFGGTFSGPVFLPRFGEGGRSLYNGRNKTFFFFSYEGLRLIVPQAALTTFVPDLCLRGVSAQCAGGATPGAVALQTFLNAFPLPNGPANGTTGMAQFVAAYSAPATIDATSVRIDHKLNNKVSFFGRYSDVPSDRVSRPNGLTLSNVFKISSLVRTMTVGSTAVFSSRLVNELRLNYTQNESGEHDALDNFGGAVPVTVDTVPNVTSFGYNAFAFALSFGGSASFQLADQFSRQRQVNLVDTLSYSMGSHALKFGVDFRRLLTRFVIVDVVRPAFTSATQVRQNLSASAVVQRTPLPAGPIYNNLSLFVHDDWKATARLNLSGGLRWEMNPPPTDAYGNLPFTANQITNPAQTVIAPKGTALWKTTLGNFAPRLGAVYRLRQDAGSETVVRGGFGVFYDLGNTFASQGYGQVGISSRSTLSNVPFPLMAAQLTLPPPSTSPPYIGVVAFDPELQLPYTLQWNVSVDQGLGSYQTITASYVGSAGRRLLVQRNIRPSVLGNANFASTAPLQIIRNDATSDYHALQLQYQRRLSRGLQVLASYTWSHSIDEASVNSLVNQLMRASSNFDIRHNFQTAVTYDIPARYNNKLLSAALRHWSLDTRFTARSALPLDVSSGTFIDATGTNQQLRANLVSNQPIYIVDATAPGGRIVNFNAFTIPTTADRTAGNFGNAPRNFLRGFSAWQLDCGVRREFPIHEGLKIQFRAEAFNIFNHPIFGAIQNNLTTGSSVFGRATGTLNSQLGGLNALYQQGGPRSFQFALKVQW